MPVQHETLVNVPVWISLFYCPSKIRVVADVERIEQFRSSNLAFHGLAVHAIRNVNRDDPIFPEAMELMMSVGECWK